MTDSLPFVGVLKTLARQAVRSESDIMIVGATARDIVLLREGQDEALRATNDVDIAVAVTRDNGFAAMTAELEALPGTAHKFHVDGVEVDVVPFGEVETAERTVTWPDGIVMNTLGLAEAYPVAHIIDLGDGLFIRVASLAAQAALKTIAWADRSAWTARDGADLGTIIDAYGQRDRLNDVYAPGNEPLLVRYEYEVPLVGAHLLGREVRTAMGTQVAEASGAIVAEDLQDRLRLSAALRLRHPRQLLKAYRDGLLE